MTQLVVTHPFATFQVGDKITDPALVEKFGKSHHAFVVRTSLEAISSQPSMPSAPSPTVPTLLPVK